MTLLKDRFVATGGQALRRVTGTVLAPYQAAVLRIGVAGCVALYLLDEWPHRETLYGPGSPFGLDLARRLVELKGSLTVLPWSGSALWFELLYHAAIVVSVLLLLGWRTRGTSVLFMVLVLSLQNRSVYMGDGGDNVLHLMAIYLVFTRCGTVWSPGARSRDRTVRVLWGGSPSGRRSRSPRSRASARCRCPGTWSFGHCGCCGRCGGAQHG